MLAWLASLSRIADGHVGLMLGSAAVTMVLGFGSFAVTCHAEKSFVRSLRRYKQQATVVFGVTLLVCFGSAVFVIITA